MLDSLVENDVPYPAKEAFDLLLTASREGKLEAFVLLCKFSQNYRATLPEKWMRAGGTTALFGGGHDLILSISQSVQQICDKMSAAERIVLATMLAQAALGNDRKPNPGENVTDLR